MNLKGKTIILTGAARIGKRVAATLGEQGANLVITYFSSKQEAEFVCDGCNEAGSQAISVQADLSKEDDVARVIEAAKQAFGRVDALVHMAATYPRTSWNEIKGSDWERVSLPITKSALLMCKAAGDVMLNNKGEEVIVDGKPAGVIRGKIVLITDWSVLTRPYADYAVYNAAKAGVVALMKSFAKELATKGITVNSIAPGPIMRPPDLSEDENTEALSKTPLGRWGGADEIAKAVMYFLDADFVTGVDLPVDGGRTIG